MAFTIHMGRFFKKKRLYGPMVACWLVTAMVFTGFRQSGVDRIMMRMESQHLQGGKRMDVRGELFYQSHNGRLLTRYSSPVQQLIITNNKGELSVYSEKDNTIYRDHGLEYSSENNLVYYFLSGRLQDLGLRELGFDLVETEFPGGMVKTTWSPPASMAHLFHRIELVHEDFIPIYAGYYDAGKAMVKKIYYTDYQHFPGIVFPTTITEFNYLPGGDSIVNRLKFSDIRLNKEADSPWFNFVIPDDAKLID